MAWAERGVTHCHSLVVSEYFFRMYILHCSPFSPSVFRLSLLVHDWLLTSLILFRPSTGSQLPEDHVGNCCVP